MPIELPGERVAIAYYCYNLSLLAPQWRETAGNWLASAAGSWAGPAWFWLGGGTRVVGEGGGLEISCVDTVYLFIVT